MSDYDDQEWKVKFWRKQAADHADRGDRHAAEGRVEEARSEYFQGARAEESAANYAQDSSDRCLILRSAASLQILAGQPWVAVSMVMKMMIEQPFVSESEELQAELRLLIRDAWKMQGITAKGDRAIADTFTKQRRRVRTGIQKMLEAKKDGEK